jgi:copper chaperone CopZ
MRTTLLIDGMRAVHCVRAVQTALTMVPGIEWCEVVVGRVEVQHTAETSVDSLRAALDITGFQLREVRQERRLPILGEP